MLKQKKKQQNNKANNNTNNSKNKSVKQNTKDNILSFDNIMKIFLVGLKYYGMKKGSKKEINISKHRSSTD